MIHYSLYGGEVADTKEEAISSGVKRFFSPRKCSRCGFNIRLVSTSQCTRCLKRRKRNPESFSKSKLSSVRKNTAINLGLKHYNGDGCKRCGLTKRLISTRQCVNCLSLRERKNRESKPSERSVMRRNAKRRSRQGRAKSREYHRRMMQTSELYRITQQTRSLLRSCFKGYKTILGYSQNELISRIEGTFKKGMSWSNYGSEWEIDHIKPISIMIREGIKDHSEINALSNLRALWKSENVGLNGYHLMKEEDTTANRINTNKP